MSRRTVRRTGAAVALVAALGLSLGVAPAQGEQPGSSASYRTTGQLADTSWLEVGPLPGVAGNIHFGYLTVQADAAGDTFAYGGVDDLQCEEGFVPENPYGGGHGGEEEEFPCEFVGSRFIDGGSVRLVMDKKFTTGRLTGTLQVSDHDGTGLGTPPVDITLTGFGGTYGGTDRGRYTGPDGSSYSYRYRSVRREATVAGRIGPMVFDDEAGEFSSSSLGTYREGSRQNLR